MRNLITILILLASLAVFLFGAKMFYTEVLTQGACPYIAGAAGAGAATTGAVAATTGAAAAKTAWIVRDGASVVTNKANIFSFAKSGNVPNVPKVTEGGLKEVAGYMKQNPNKKLNLIGDYEGKEKNPSKFANLGTARAESIKAKLVKYGVPAAAITTSGALANNLKFNEENRLPGGVAFNFIGAAPAAAAGLAINDGSGFRTTAPNNLTFNKSNYEFNTPMPKEVATSFKEVSTYLGKNPTRMITVNGMYHKDEKNNSLLPNLGLARANNVKNALVKYGVRSSQILTGDKLMSNLKFDKSNKLTGGIEYLFSTKAADAVDTRLKDVEKRLRTIGPQYLYFETGKDVVILDKEKRQYFSDLIYFLDRKSGASVNVIGHTDSKGDANANKSLGNRRANFIKSYLGKNGAPSKQIASSSQGEAKPIATNDTEKGRAKNRRVEIAPVFK